jgi:hypothetical protein
LSSKGENPNTKKRQMIDEKLKQGDRVDINTLANYCGYFYQSKENNGYGCNHPDNCENCHSFACPLAVELREEEGYDEEDQMVELVMNEEDF